MRRIKLIAALCSVLYFGSLSSLCFAEEVIMLPEMSFTNENTEQYKIVYDTDGGEGKIENQESYVAGEEVKLSVWALKKNGYSHTGWTDGENIYERGQSITMPENNLELKAVYKKIYTVTYEDVTKYGYPSTLTNSTVVPGTEIMLPNYAMFNGNAKFDGWLVNGVHYNGRTAFIMPEEDVYIQVDWLSPIKITYSAGTEDSVVKGTVVFEKFPGKAYELPDATRLSRIGYRLIGWKDTVTGEEYDLEDTYMPRNEDTVINAIWEPVKIGIDFDSNGGTGEMSSFIAVNDEPFILPECEFKKEGSRFICWEYKGKYYRPDVNISLKMTEFAEAFRLNAVWMDESINPGDMNGDGIADLNDLTCLSLYLVGDMEIKDETKLLNADVTADGVINICDLAHYKQYIGKDNVILGLK